MALSSVIFSMTSIVNCCVKPLMNGRCLVGIWSNVKYHFQGEELTQCSNSSGKEWSGGHRIGRSAEEHGVSLSLVWYLSVSDLFHLVFPQ